MPPCSPTEQNSFMTLVDAATSMINDEGESSVSSTPPMITPTATPPPSSPTPLDQPRSMPSSPKETLKSAKKESFAATLMNLLLDEKYSKIVTFLPDNQSFGIINAKVFSDEVMPEVFGIRTFSSFVRKLNRWGFERIMEKKTHDVDVFRHRLFFKNNLKLCAKIKCVGRLSKHQQPEVVKSLQLRRPVPMCASAAMKPTVAAPTRPVFHSQALNDVTSQVVTAALDTLRRDEKVTQTMTQARMQQLLACQRVRAQMMALRASRMIIM